MNKLVRSLARPRSAAVALGVLIATLVPFQAGVLSSRRPAPVSAPEPLPVDVPHLDPRSSLRPPTPSPSPSPSPRVRPTRTPEPVAPAPPPPKGPRIGMFRGLGAWVDTYDYPSVEPASAIETMRRYGVRTVYLQTGRFSTEHDVAPEVGPWLAAAHAAGMQAVGWYLPSYERLSFDVRRAAAVASYRYEGHSFDAVGVDIEWKQDVANETWNRRVVKHLERVQAAVPRRYAVAAIVPPPLQMDVAPERWAGFPWRGIGANSDVVMLMSYWSYRDCENIPDHCAYPFTYKNLAETRRLIGDARLPIHTIGGVGDRVTKDEVGDFVRGARRGEAFGASIYDFQTTAQDFWPLLARLRSL